MFPPPKSKLLEFFDWAMLEPSTRARLKAALLDEETRLDNTYAELAKAAVLNPERRAAALAALGECSYVAGLRRYVERKE